MCQSEYEAALSEFLRNKGVTRCPTACVAVTGGSVAETDKAALRSYEDAQKAARLQKLVAFRRKVPAMPVGAAIDQSVIPAGIINPV